MKRLEKGLIVGGILGLAMTIYLGMSGDAGKIKHGGEWAYVPGMITALGSFGYGANEIKRNKIVGGDLGDLTTNNSE